MIEEIEIRDLGVIAEATLPLGAGFTAITGETGAGKTMVVTALGLLLGGRADAGVVRAGAARTQIDGRWVVDEAGPVSERVRDAGGDVDGFGDAGQADLTLGRTITVEGRSRAQVGGRSAPNGVLSEIGEHLVAVHGQADQMRLKTQAARRDAVDRAADAELDTVLADYRKSYDQWLNDSEELERLTAERQSRQIERDELIEGINAIDAVDPQPGEDVELREKAERLENLEELRVSAMTAREALSSEMADGADVLALIEEALRSVDRGASMDANSFEGLASQLRNVSSLVADCAGELSSYLASLEVDDGAQLDQVNERRAAVESLMRKYGPGLEDVLAYRETGQMRAAELEGDNDRIAELEEAVEQGKAAVESGAAKLTDLRTQAAEALAERITAELGSLAMPDASLLIEVAARDTLTRDGADDIRFLLSPHKGAVPRPLGKSASGGELSRVMLAIEVVISHADRVPTYIFDEVDAGVGGAAAIEIGRRLARLAEHAQVIVVTHLAQVAAFAGNHLSVVKEDDGFVTRSSVARLDGEARTAEMARLLSGLSDSETGLAHAEELLDMARGQARMVG